MSPTSASSSPGSAPYAEALRKIKTMLQEPVIEFHLVQEEFLQMTETTPAFREAGIRIKALRPDELALVRKTLASKGKDFAGARSVVFVRLVEHAFLHGTCIFDMTDVVTIIYFTDIRVGLMTLSRMSSLNVDYLRFSAVPMPPGRESAPLN